MLPKIGAKSAIKSFASAVESVDDVRQQAKAITGRDIDEEFDRALEGAWALANESIERDVQVLAFDNIEYPEALRRIPDPPPFLYVRGTLPRTWESAVAVIGTREPDPAALEATRAATQSLSSDPSVILVSGLALGIDSEAHREALRTGAVTVAVLANGLDSVYPKRNEKLAEEIVERGGALVSELPIGVKVLPYNLVARDRLQSGLSIATIVIQTSTEGGSMHTARFTLEQGRSLIALRPQGPSQSWSGNRFLTTRPEAIDWEGLSDRLQRFRRFARASARLAISMDEARIPEFIGMGLRAHFIPRQAPELGIEREPEPETLRLNL
jgi:DNA protecting protein DprA